MIRPELVIDDASFHANLSDLRHFLRRSVAQTWADRLESARAARSRQTSDGFPLRDMKVRFAGRTLNVLVREGTIDADLVHMILRADGEYCLPAAIDPEIIFDAGANIGITALYFALRYPRARLFCFEPLSENYELLRENVRRNKVQAHVMPCGLSDRNASMEYFYSADPRNLGGGGFHRSGTDPRRRVTVDVATTSKIMTDLGINRIDLFKIDTEGHEMHILRGIPEVVRRNAQAFIGELHGECDWQFCDALTPSHAVGVQKRYQASCFPFIAVRKDLVEPKQRSRAA